MDDLDSRLFVKSGLNSTFQGKGLLFSEYLQQTQAIIAKARIDLHSPDSATILAANSPFEWRPHQFDQQRGILLLHGLYDSPFLIRDLAQHFLRRGFLVRSVLLPGHGTVPGDLLDINYHEWLKAAEYGIEQLSKEVKMVHMGGYSLGGLLTLFQAMHHPELAAIFLFEPALTLTHPHIAHLFGLHKWLPWHKTKFDWFHKNAQDDYAKYESFTFDSISQIYHLSTAVLKRLRKQTLAMPIFALQCQNDEVIVSQKVLKFFTEQPNAANRMLLYSPIPITFSDERIVVKSSNYPELNILDFSHVGVTNSPQNPHYGEHGDYKDFLHYPNKVPPTGEVFLGPRPKHNHHNSGLVIQRLTYNPDFMGLTRAIDLFLKSLY